METCLHRRMDDSERRCLGEGRSDVDPLLLKIERTRGQRGMDVSVLCRKAGIVPATYYHWLSGISSPKLCSLNDVLEALGLKMLVIEGGKGDA